MFDNTFEQAYILVIGDTKFFINMILNRDDFLYASSLFLFSSSVQIIPYCVLVARKNVSELL